MFTGLFKPGRSERRIGGKLFLVPHLGEQRHLISLGAQGKFSEQSDR